MHRDRFTGLSSPGQKNIGGHMHLKNKTAKFKIYEYEASSSHAKSQELNFESDAKSISLNAIMQKMVLQN